MLVLALPVLALALAQGEPPAPGAAQPPAAEPPPAQGPAVEPEPPPTAPKPAPEPEPAAPKAAAEPEPPPAAPRPVAEPEPPPAEPPPTAPKPVGEPEGQAAQKAPPQRLRSVLSGETLGKGGAVGLGMAGYPALGAVYLQAISEGDDLGGLAELDWAATDFLAEGVWRHAAWRSGGTSLGLRLAAGFYACFGATHIYAENAADAGARAAPGAALSFALGQGLLTLGSDLPFTITFSRGGGFIFAPRAWAALEAPLYGDLSAGTRAGVGGRWASGGAPGSGTGRTLLEIEALLTWRMF